MDSVRYVSGPFKSSVVEGNSGLLGRPETWWKIAGSMVSNTTRVFAHNHDRGTRAISMEIGEATWQEVEGATREREREE